MGNAFLVRVSQSTWKVQWRQTFRWHKWSICRIAFIHTLCASQPLHKPNNSFFEGALPGSGDLGRATLIPHHVTSQEGNHLTKERDRISTSLIHQRSFRPPAIAKGVAFANRIRYITPGKTCTRSSQWQTGPVCSQLACLIRGPWVLETARGYHLTLNQWQTRMHLD